MNATEYRLTSDDEARITRRIAETVELWRSSMVTRRPFSFTEEIALQRVAAGAIGCTEADLRDCELDWLRDACTDAMRDTVR